MNLSTPSIAVAVALIVRGDGSLLLGQRPEGKPYAGAWEFAGGKLEPGESFEQALQRELREELEIDVEVEREVHREESTYPDGRTFCVAYFLVRRWSGSITNRAFADLRWVAPVELRTLDILQGNRAICERIAAGAIDTAQHSASTAPPHLP